MVQVATSRCADVVARWQRFDPETGEFTLRRTNAEYARLLGDIDPGLLTRLYKGELVWSWQVLRGLLRAFPAASDEVVALMSEVA